MLIEFNDDLVTLTYEEKLKMLLAYHNMPLTYKVDKEDMPMVVLALNQDDITTVTVDDEGALEIGYSGDGNEWAQQ